MAVQECRMQLIKYFLVLLPLSLLPFSLMAQDCATLIKLQSPYLQTKKLYLDELLSQRVVNNQICISSDEMQYLDSTYHLELFSDTGRTLESIHIFPEYAQADVIYITTADLLSDYCRHCEDISQYKRFIDLPIVQEVATEMDNILAQNPKSNMADIIKEKFQRPLSTLHEFGSDPDNAVEKRAVEKRAVVNNAVVKSAVVKNTTADNKANQSVINSSDAVPDGIVIPLLPDVSLPIYSGAELTHFLPQGLNIEAIKSLPLATYSINASSESVLDFYQTYYPDHEIVPFGSFKVLVKEKLPIDGYSPEYMAIPHLVISEDPLGKGKTILHIIYQSAGADPES